MVLFGTWQYLAVLVSNFWYLSVLVGTLWYFLVLFGFVGVVLMRLNKFVQLLKNTNYETTAFIFVLVGMCRYVLVSRV